MKMIFLPPPQTGKYGLFRPEMEGAKDLTQEPRSAKIEKYFPGAPVRSAFNITCLLFILRSIRTLHNK